MIVFHGRNPFNWGAISTIHEISFAFNLFNRKIHLTKSGQHTDYASSCDEAVFKSNQFKG